MALLALIIAVAGSRKARSQDEELAQRVYQRILGEVWREVKPVYEEYDLDTRTRPDSFGALLTPLLSLNRRPTPTGPGPATRRANPLPPR